jgi:hypothetical protein
LEQLENAHADATQALTLVRDNLPVVELIEMCDIWSSHIVCVNLHTCTLYLCDRF